MPWISNHKHKIKEKINKKFPVLLQSCRPRTGRPVEISNTDKTDHVLLLHLEKMTQSSHDFAYITTAQLS